MFGLRQKLVIGFGGLILILLLIESIGVIVLNRYSGALDKFIYENYRSVVYGQKMKDAVIEMEGAADAQLAGNSADAGKLRDEGRRLFDENLDLEMHNITLRGEQQAADDVAAAWKAYQENHQKLFAASLAPAERDRLHAAVMQDQARTLELAAQKIVDMNLDNMVKENGQVKDAAATARRLMFILVIIGAGLAIAFVAVLSRAILQPLQALTRSAKEIEQGNLDLVAPVRSRDELGQLAEAFNSMASRLREFRRSDRAKLIRTQRTTQLALNSLPDPIAIISPEGRVELANEPAQRLFSLQPDAEISAAPGFGLHELFRRAWQEGRVIQPRGYESAIQIYEDGGQERFFLPQAVPIVDVDKQLVGVTLVLADVTNLRRIDEMKSGMLSVVSHELKTPLTSIRMGEHILLEERIGSLNPKQTEILVAMRDDTDRLNRIIENLLDISRIESGRAMMDLRPAAATALVTEALEPFKRAFHDHGVELVADVPDDTPEVLVDKTRIGHVFSNLLSNALKYTPAGGKVKASAAVEETVVRFRIQDTGAGIEEKYLKRIFERFFRVPEQSGASGAGLGLAIAKEIVLAHGGQISVESQPDKGSTFSFTLQRADTAKPEADHEIMANSDRG